MCLQEEFYSSSAVEKFPFRWIQKMLSATGTPKVEVLVIRHQASFSCRKVDK